MKEEYINALVYLNNFPEGLSRYTWDRSIVYKLKSELHPGEFIQYFISEGLIKNTNIVERENYVISERGKEKVKEYLFEFDKLIRSIINAIHKIEEEGYEIKIEEKLPIISFSFLGRKFRFLICRKNEDRLVLFFPTETKEQENEFSLSLEMVIDTSIIYDISLTHINYLKQLS
jgi:hypothetical protein